MKKLVIAVLFLALGTAVAQEAPAANPFGTEVSPPNANVTERLIPITRSDVYCSGFATNQPVPRTNFVTGGLNSPYQTRFADRDFVFLKGTNLQPGNLVSIIREIKNPDVEIYNGVGKLKDQIGKPFLDIGYARVTELRAEVAVAQIEFACTGILPGDIVMPFVERPAISTRATSTLDRFPAEKPALAGKIAMAENFDQLVSAGRKVFINLGWEKGVRCGDYFKITRKFSPRETDGADVYSYQQVEVDDSQAHPAKLKSGNKFKEVPRRLVGELIILNVTPSSATGMLTFALEEVHAGDSVELEPRDGESMVHTGSN